MRSYKERVLYGYPELTPQRVSVVLRGSRALRNEKVWEVSQDSCKRGFLVKQDGGGGGKRAS